MSLLLENCSTEGIATLSLNLPKKRNALSCAMISELSDAAERLSQDANVRVVILKGEGKSFCAGADLDWMRQQFSTSDVERRNEALRAARLFRLLYQMPKPLIGQLHGGVFGGGAGLAAVCDVAIAGRSTSFAFPETRLGLIPATISPYVIAKTGSVVAKRLFMSGKVFGAKEAEEFGLVTMVVDDEELNSAVLKEADSYLTCAPSAVAAAKNLVHTLDSQIDESMVVWTADQLAARWGSEEAQKGVSAFFDGKKQDWRTTK